MKGTRESPPDDYRDVVCFCPEWNNSGYQIAYYDHNEGKFRYAEQLNDSFDSYVISWVDIPE